MKKLNEIEEKEILARTIWGEARGEGIPGMVAVANVIRNRREYPGRWGSTWRSVCLKRWQFSCWNENDPNRQRLIDGPDGTEMRQARIIADMVMNNLLIDNTAGATHYHTHYVKPNWMDHPSMKPRGEIGNHIFYREG